jgi:hypothetical protein
MAVADIACRLAQQYDDSIWNEYTRHHSASVSKEIWKFAFKQQDRGKKHYLDGLMW